MYLLCLFMIYIPFITCRQVQSPRSLHPIKYSPITQTGLYQNALLRHISHVSKPVQKQAPAGMILNWNILDFIITLLFVFRLVPLLLERKTFNEENQTACE